MKNWIFVDCEAFGACPALGTLTEFGAVCYADRSTFHGVLAKSEPDPANPACPLPVRPPTQEKLVEVFTAFEAWLNAKVKSRPSFISDNPAYDFQWINDGFWRALGRNPFGHSGRRISDYYAGLCGDFGRTQDWKSLRVTPHDHNPVNDAMGNVEAFERILRGERGRPRR